MREVGGERNRREQLSQTKAPLSVARVRSTAFSRPTDDPSIMGRGRTRLAKRRRAAP